MWGHIVDDWDRRMCEKYLNYFMQAAWQCPNVSNEFIIYVIFLKKKEKKRLEYFGSWVYQNLTVLSTSFNEDGMHWRWWSCGNCFSWNSWVCQDEILDEMELVPYASWIFPWFSDVFRWFCSGIIRLGSREIRESRESREILKTLQAAIDSWRTTLPITGTPKKVKNEREEELPKRIQKNCWWHLVTVGGDRKDCWCPPYRCPASCICHSWRQMVSAGNPLALERTRSTSNTSQLGQKMPEMETNTWNRHGVLRRPCPRSLPCSSGCIRMQKSTSVPRCGLDGSDWICPPGKLENYSRNHRFQKVQWVRHVNFAPGYGIYGICQYRHIWWYMIYIRQIASHWVSSLVGSLYHIASFSSNCWSCTSH